MTVPRWMSDLTLGVRLAVGGGRTAWARLALSAVGIGIATSVLLVGASADNIQKERESRQLALLADTNPVAGVHPTYVDRRHTEFRGEIVGIEYVAPSAPDSPRPAGLAALPKPGEMYASPALARLLASPDGELLRPRLPEKLVAELPKDLVEMPGSLSAVVGVDPTVIAGLDTAYVAYGFGHSAGELNAEMLLLLMVGGVVLLLPVFVFVSSASRIAGAERDRRLSALRLVGAGSRQVRRIAAAESLAGAFAGLVLGAAVFLVARQFADRVNLFGAGAYVSDVVPDPLMTVLIVLLIPALSVLTALFALRRTIVEPLGVVRQSKPVRRRLWWRLVPVVLGVVLLTTQLGADDNDDLWVFSVTGGVALLLVGVPVLLPWLVERVAGRANGGGPPSWLLALRRLQLDSGTSARVVGGVAVVLAGAIALQTLLMSFEGAVGLPGSVADEPPAVHVEARAEHGDEVAREVAAADGVRGVHVLRHAWAYPEGEKDAAVSLLVADCAALTELTSVGRCADGEVFLAADDYGPQPKPGMTLEWREFDEPQEFAPQTYTVTDTWVVPADARTVGATADSAMFASVIITPGAIDGTVLSELETVSLYAGVDPDLTGDQLEGIRNAVADHRLETYVYSYNTGPDLTLEQATYVAIRTALYAGSIFTLLLAGVSLLVLALEHIRERRRTLAILAASGVPRGVLARSLLWQVALPITLGVAVALATGIGLAALVVRLAETPLAVDWAGVVLLSAGAIVLSLVVSAMTMPFLRNATRLTALRTE